VTEIIKSHALGEDVKSLWLVFSEHLEVAAGNAGTIYVHISTHK
jgi:hypothetical protein